MILSLSNAVCSLLSKFTSSILFFCPVSLYCGGLTRYIIFYNTGSCQHWKPSKSQTHPLPKKRTPALCIYDLRAECVTVSSSYKKYFTSLHSNKPDSVLVVGLWLHLSSLGQASSVRDTLFSVSALGQVKRSTAGHCSQSFICGETSSQEASGSALADDASLLSLGFV